MLKTARAREIGQRVSLHRLILAALLGVAVLAVPGTGRTDGDQDGDQNDGPKALWVANGGGPNVLEFSSFQFGSNGVVSTKPHRVNSSGVFVNRRTLLSTETAICGLLTAGMELTRARECLSLPALR